MSPNEGTKLNNTPNCKGVIFFISQIFTCLVFQIPFIIPQIKMLGILSIIGSLQRFDYQLILTGGGPGSSTTVPALIMYNESMNNSRYGFASAVGLFLFVKIMKVTLLNHKFLKTETG
jgi:ABC-type sugar transport system permease subunit